MLVPYHYHILTYIISFFFDFFFIHEKSEDQFGDKSASSSFSSS